MDTGEWTWDSDYKRAILATADPRILAVIERDEYPEAPYGDALCPAYYVDRGTAGQAGDVYHDGESDDLAQRYLDARDRFQVAAGYRYNGLSTSMIDRSERMLERWLRIFYDARAQLFSAGYQSDTTVLLLDTPGYREHVGADTPEALAYRASIDDDELFRGEREEWIAFIEGEVYGIGWAVNEQRVTDETPLPDVADLEAEGWEVSLECWGFYGEDYAKRSAADFEAGSPTLPEMLEAS
ncbi:MAG: Microbacterium phage OneinaGillian [Actinomycetota bacterium]